MNENNQQQARKTIERKKEAHNKFKSVFMKHAHNYRCYFPQTTRHYANHQENFIILAKLSRTFFLFTFSLALSRSLCFLLLDLFSSPFVRSSPSLSLCCFSITMCFASSFSFILYLRLMFLNLKTFSKTSTCRLYTHDQVQCGLNLSIFFVQDTKHFGSTTENACIFWIFSG